MKNMRNLTKLMFSRVVLVSVAILLQVAFLVSGLWWLRDVRRWIMIASTVLSWAMVLYIISGRSNPSYKIAWIIPILIFPVGGIVLFLCFGGNKSSSRDNRKMERIFTRNAALLPQQPPQVESPAALYHSEYLRRVSSFGAYCDSDAAYFPLGELCAEKMLCDLKTAEKSIYLESFIIERGVFWDGILQILREKAAQGVDVRVLYDDFGCIRRLPAAYYRQLREMGVRAYAFSPFVPIVSARLNNRDHRKLLIIDGRIGYTGGVNLADEYINAISPLGHWKDCGIRIEGSAVRSMSVMFLTMWEFVSGKEERLPLPEITAQFPPSGFIQPFSDSPLDTEDVGACVYQNLIHNARRTLYMMTPYLILDDSMANALCTAAHSGVDVRIITPGTPDKWYVHAVTRANYDALIEAGVRIYEYTPGFIHSKVCLADGQLAMVGTVNMDFRSLYLHYEDAVLLHNCKAVLQVEEDFAKTFPLCREITGTDCRHVHWYQRFGRSLLRMFSPLM